MRWLSALSSAAEPAAMVGMWLVCVLAYIFQGPCESVVYGISKWQYGTVIE